MSAFRFRGFGAAAWLGLGLVAALAGEEPARIVPGIGLKLSPIPSGTFTMGSPKSETAHRDNESPQTEVTLTHAFWLGTYEVTCGQWKAVMGTDLLEQARRTQQDNASYWVTVGHGKKMMVLRDFFGIKKDADPAEMLGNRDDDLPIVWVNWTEAADFCRRLTATEKAAGRLPAGYEYRLPTEAEWEYACRAGTTSATYAGELAIGKGGDAPVLNDIAWYSRNSSVGYSGHAAVSEEFPPKKVGSVDHAGPRRVGTKSPNVWGLYDMLGNAAEWCLDWSGPYPGGRVTDWAGPSSGIYRVRRGGGWSTLAAPMRAAYRNWHEPGYRWVNLGFRVALAPVIDR